MAKDYARRRTNSKPQARWPWIIVGLSVGLLIAWLGQPLFQNYLDSKKSSLSKVQKPDLIPKNSKPSTEGKESQAARFDFYHLLPKMEVDVSANNPSGRFQLQAGVFRELKEAEKLKAQLALLGYPSHIQITNEQGLTHHRVKLGPFETFAAVQAAQAALKKENIATILMKVS